MAYLQRVVSSPQNATAAACSRLHVQRGGHGTAGGGWRWNTEAMLQMCKRETGLNV